MQELTERLTMVLGQVRYARQDSSIGKIIDVGSDHGYLAIRCLEEGLADEVYNVVPQEHRIKIPMAPNSRCLNLSNSVAVVAYEAWRQLGFENALV